MKELPTNRHITFQLQYRKCGKASCSTCHNGLGHGPYWYAYWREGPRLRSGYIGKVHARSLGYVSEAQQCSFKDSTKDSTISPDRGGTVIVLPAGDFATASLPA